MKAVSIGSDFDYGLDDLMTFSTDIVAEKYLNDILRLVVTVTANAAEIDVCLLFLRDGNNSGKKPRLKAWYGIDADSLKVFPIAECKQKVEEIIAAEEPLAFSDLSFPSVLGLPLRAHDGVLIGVLLCFSNWAHMFTPKLIKRMSRVADKAVTAILGTELLVKARIAQEELETLTILEKTKKFLMARQGIGAEEATTRILNYSTESISSPRRAAETILLSDIA